MQPWLPVSSPRVRAANNEHGEQRKADGTKGRQHRGRERERERRRSKGMVVGEKREGMGDSVSNDRCFIGEGWAVSHSHSSMARIEILKPNLDKRRRCRRQKHAF